MSDTHTHTHTRAGLPPAAELEAVLKVAQDAARRAGARIAASCGRTSVDKEKASSQDLVTVVDREAQAIIEDAISTAFPTHSILGEESVDAGAAASARAIDALAEREWLWVIDPLDGTTNFVHGIPLSTVSIGVAHKGTVVVGVVYDPYRDELFHATRGGGAFLNGAPIRVSSETSMKKALFAYGLHHTVRVAHVMLRGVGAIVDISRGARSLGSAALHLAYVAAGRLTGFWELDLSSWDLAAGSLLVQEAGGRASDVRGEAYTLRTRDMLATNGAPDVHDGAVSALRAANAHQVGA